MFEEIAKSSFANLSTQQRADLADLLRMRVEYMKLAAQLNEMRVDLLESFTPEKEAGIEAFSAAVVAPKRKAVALKMTEMMTETVDLEQIKSLMPMILAGMLGSVNLGMLLAVVGIEPDQVAQLESAITNFTKRGM